MRDARRFISWEASHGVQGRSFGWAAWSGSTVVALSGAAPPVFGRLCQPAMTSTASPTVTFPSRTTVKYAPNTMPSSALR